MYLLLHGLLAVFTELFPCLYNFICFNFPFQNNVRLRRRIQDDDVFKSDLSPSDMVLAHVIPSVVDINEVFNEEVSAVDINEVVSIRGECI